MTRDISSSDDQIDMRDVTDRVEELRDELADNEAISPIDEGGVVQSSDGATDLTAKAEELAMLEALLDELRGRGGDHDWEGAWYPLGLINESYFTDAMMELVQDIGDLPLDIPGYLVIDWEATAENLRADYSSVEFDGVTFWYR